MDYATEAARLDKRLRESLRHTHKRGLVLGVSGGIDSSVSLALAVRAVGPERVFALLMPERDSSDDSERRGRMLCEKLGVPFALENIAEALEGAGCYRRRDEAISRLLPDYVPGWRHKIVVNAPGETTFAYFKLVVEKPGGEQVSVRMPNDVYLQVVAATNFKQRIRKNLDYYHADRLNFAVIGTPNKLEYDLGFFVRGGDGLADVKPIAHLYKRSSTPWRAISACPRRSATRRRAPTLTACRRRRRSSTSPCPITRPIWCFTAWTTTSPPLTWPAPWG
jgi:NAD+ synthase